MSENQEPPANLIFFLGVGNVIKGSVGATVGLLGRLISWRGRVSSWLGRVNKQSMALLVFFKSLLDDFRFAGLY